MTSINRTAYPQLNKQLSNEELSCCYELTHDDVQFVQRQARNDRGYLVLATILKTRIQLGYFIALNKIPQQIISYLARQLELPDTAWKIDDKNFKRSFYRYRAACQKHIGSTAFSVQEEQELTNNVRKAAYTMSDPADLINVAIETLSNENIELPAFSRLDRLVNRERHAIHSKIYTQITHDLTSKQCQILDGLLEVEEDHHITWFAQMKQSPGPATLGRFRAWASRLIKLDSILDPKPFLSGIAYTKIRQFASEASAYSLSDIRGVHN